MVARAPHAQVQEDEEHSYSSADNGWQADVLVVALLAVGQPYQVIQQREKQVAEGERLYACFFFLLGQSAEEEGWHWR